MASTGFKTISQVAEILDRPEIDGTARHFILNLLTRTLGENIQLQDSLIKKDCEIADLQAKIQEQDDNAERALGETAEVIEQLEEEIKMLDDSRQKAAKQLTEKDAEIEEHKKTIESLGDQLREKDDNSERALGENAEVIEQLEKKIKGYKENWQRQFHQLKENHLLLENLEASIEYLQEQVKEKDEEITRLKEKNVGNVKSKKYVECKHDDETIYYYPVTKDN